MLYNSHRLNNLGREKPRKSSQTNTEFSVTETYVSHPELGLLNNLCIVDEQTALYTSLYANRLFFLVTASTNGLIMNTISRNEARITIEKRLSVLRKSSFYKDYEHLKKIYKITFNR